jgi:hypothetical protein
VEGRVSDVIGFNLRGPLDDRDEKLRHFRVCSTVVSLGILCLVPQTDSERFPAALGNKRYFVLEFLFVLEAERGCPSLISGLIPQRDWASDACKLCVQNLASPLSNGLLPDNRY